MQGLAHNDPDVLNRMVFVDIDVAFGLDGQIEEPMLGQQLQHVVEEANPCVDLPLSTAVQRPFDQDIRFLRGAVDARLPGNRSVLLHENLLWAALACASNPSMWANRTR